MTLTNIKTKNLMKSSGLKKKLMESAEELVESGIEMLAGLNESITIQGNATTNSKKASKGNKRNIDGN